MKNHYFYTIFMLFFLFLSCKNNSNVQSDPNTKGNPALSLKDQIVQSRYLRERMQSDPHRPTYHFVNPEGRAYPFDPNGAIYWKGRYHLGFIYQSLRNGIREHFWGHAVSTDLLHWTLYPDMLNVVEGDIEKGIFSGGAFLSKEGIPHIIYHGEGSSTNLVAYSKDDDLKNWTKFEGNPVLKTPEKGDPLHDKYWAWDPEGWYDKETDFYYQISGGPIAGFFRSKDMMEWEYMGDLIDQNNRMRQDFEDLSCPDFFPIGNKHMLLFISHNLGTQYYLGTYKNGKFTPEKHARMNWPGGTFFAPEQLVDDKGRNIIWGWVLERNPEIMEWAPKWDEEIENPQEFPEHGWSGIMSIPRVVSLSDAGEVLINPPVEIQQLRLEGIEENNLSIAANNETKLNISGKALEIKVEMRGGNEPYGVKVFTDPNGLEETVIKYDPKAKQLVIDFFKSAKDGPVKMRPNIMLEPELEGFLEDVSEQRAPLELASGESLRLDIFIDHQIIEVFANGRQCMTQVVYPKLKESEGVKLFSEGETVIVPKVEAWHMAETNAY